MTGPQSNWATPASSGCMQQQVMTNTGHQPDTRPKHLCGGTNQQCACRTAVSQDDCSSHQLGRPWDSMHACVFIMEAQSPTHHHHHRWDRQISLCVMSLLKWRPILPNPCSAATPCACGLSALHHCRRKGGRTQASSGDLGHLLGVLLLRAGNRIPQTLQHQYRCATLA